MRQVLLANVELYRRGLPQPLLHQPFRFRQQQAEPLLMMKTQLLGLGRLKQQALFTNWLSRYLGLDVYLTTG